MKDFLLLLLIFALGDFLSVAFRRKEAPHEQGLSVSSEKQCKILNCNNLFIRGEYLLQILVKCVIQLTSSINAGIWCHETII